MLTKVTKYLNDPPFLRKFHGWAAVVWLIISVPILIWFSESVAVVVFISVYANVVGHWSSWQAARVEEKQAEQEKREAEEQDRLVERIDEITPDPE